MPNSQEVKNMFKAVAPRYDFINSLLSLGLDQLWRKMVVQKIRQGSQPEKILDVACGSGALTQTLAKAFAPKAKVMGVDFCQPLLDLARQKKNLDAEFVLGDALALPVAPESIDVITVAFGLRNFEDRPQFYAEALRVLKPQARLYILEFSQPYNWIKPFYYLYQKILPSIAKIAGGTKNAYQYLNRSINAFPDAQSLKKQLQKNGFTDVQYYQLTGGIVALHSAQKPR